MLKNYLIIVESRLIKKDFLFVWVYSTIANDDHAVYLIRARATNGMLWITVTEVNATRNDWRVNTYARQIMKVIKMNVQPQHRQNESSRTRGVVGQPARTSLFSLSRLMDSLLIPR